jgi:hypothetical protein
MFKIGFFPYNTVINIVNFTIPAGPIFNPTRQPINPYRYSSSAQITAFVNLKITYTSATWDSNAQLYMKVSSKPPTEATTWDTIDPPTLGYQYTVDNNSVVAVPANYYIIFAVVPLSSTADTVTVNILNNGNNTLITSFTAERVIP